MGIARRIRVARGEEAGDLILRNGQLVNVCSGEIYPADVVIVEGTIAAIGEPGQYEAREAHDLGGRFLVPGLIDGHMHIESTMMTLAQFAQVVVPHGTTTVIIDPHEYANVMGVEGIRYALASGRNLPLTVYAVLSSCVPASPLESPRQVLSAADLLPLLEDDRVLGLAEMMDVPGVLHANPQVLAKIEATRARGRVVDGHAPGVRGRDLNAYAAAGIMSDHESTAIDEAREKLRLGMWLMVREGSAARNLEALLPLIKELNPPRACFVTDDRDPVDLVTRGHIDSMVRMAIAGGLSPMQAIRMGSLNTAQYFRLDDRGAIVPGYVADILIVGDLERFDIQAAYKEGALVAQAGKALFAPPASENAGASGGVNTGTIQPEQLRIPGHAGDVAVIGIEPGQITTLHLTEAAPLLDGEIVPDLSRDLLKLVVVERHHASGRVGLALVKGFRLRQGAIVSTVAHDAHNLVIAGTNDADILRAIEAINELGGGFALVVDGQVRASVPLPLGGLVSLLPVEQLVGQLQALDSAAAALGCTLEHPFMTLSFLSLSVIPSLKLTDQGLIDVAAAQVVPLQA
ncbi:MAG TPA: adenine deaminase [Ktedonobacterales bacterium]|jgi:adenine deaminase